MPLPKKHTGEAEKDFVSRCMGDSVMLSDYPDQEHRAAVCYKQFGNEVAKEDGIQKSFIGTTIFWSAIKYLANEMAGELKWVQLAPYGEFPHPRGLQKIDEDDAKAIVEDFNNTGNIGAQTVGLPWYIGHPDDKHFKQFYNDTRAVGRIKEMRADPVKGLMAGVKFNEEGIKLLKDEAFHGHSVNWGMVNDGLNWRPRSLKSVGFTNEPNIPVEPVTLANEDKTMPDMTKLRAALAAKDTDSDDDCVANAVAGLAQWKANQDEMTNMKKSYDDLTNAHKDVSAKWEAANAKLTTVMDAHKQVAAATKGREEALSALSNEKEAWTAEKTGMETTITNLKVELEAGKVAFANERKLSIKAQIASAVTTGKIMKAEIEQFEAHFANEYEKTVEKIEAMKPKLHTVTLLEKRTTMPADQRTRADQVLTFVNEKIEKEHLPYDEAFARVKKEKPELFLEMNEPEAVKAAKAKAGK
jgi:hypothetical protein